MAEISETSGDALNFEEFLKAITTRIVTLFSYFRDLHSPRKEEALTSVCMTSKEEVSSPLMNSSTLTTNSNTDSARTNSGKSFTQLEVTTPRQLPLRSSTSTFKRSWPAESLLFDFGLFFMFVLFVGFIPNFELFNDR